MNDLAKAQSAARDAAAASQPAQPTVSVMEWGAITNTRLSALEEQMSARLLPLEEQLTAAREIFSKVARAVRIRLDRLDARLAKAESPATYEIIYLPDSSGTGKGRFIVLGEPK